MKILIVSDYSSRNMLGAPIVIESWIRYLENEHSVFALFYDEIFGLSKMTYQKNKLKRILNLKSCFMLLFHIKKIKPDLVWFHNINNCWSWASSIVPYICSVDSILTLHDLSSIYEYKVTPELIDNYTYKLNMENSKILNQKRLRNIAIRYLVSKTRHVSIGEINTVILQQNGMRVDALIPNSIDSCGCKVTDSYKFSKSVLFAGRAAHKGLDVVISSIIKSEGWTLYLAGEQELKEIALRSLSPNQFVYLGRLSNSELVKYIHKMSFVAVLSTYYDNFPTIALEALVHNSLPLTTTLTGVHKFVEIISPEFVFKPFETVDFCKLENINVNKSKVESLSKLFTNHRNFIEKYLNILH